MIFLDDSLGNWILAKDRRELLDVLLARLPDPPTLGQLETIAAACLGCLETDIIMTEDTDTQK